MRVDPERVCLRFESFELDSETGELLKKGHRLRLQDQPTRLLILLASRSGELVTRSEIRDTLWPDGEFVEFEHAINTAIRKIRSVLEDDPEHPRLIETVPRKGYRFIGAVDAIRQPVTAEAPRAAVETGPISTASNAAPAAAPASEDFAMEVNRARSLFLLIQVGYLLMYCTGLLYFSELDTALARAGLSPVWLTFPSTIVIAMCGIAVRLYLLSSVGLRHPAAGRQFRKIFPFVFILDALWAASPLLIAPTIGVGLALAGVSGLAYLPFSQRTLMRRIGPPRN